MGGKRTDFKSAKPVSSTDNDGKDSKGDKTQIKFGSSQSETSEKPTQTKKYNKKNAKRNNTKDQIMKEDLEVDANKTITVRK